jgi:phospholipid transport system substrate-binding protein
VTVDPKKPSAKPFEVNFRVQTVNGRMLVVDFSVEGVWIRELERNDFTSYLGQKNGDVKALVTMLKQKAAQTR